MHSTASDPHLDHGHAAPDSNAPDSNAPDSNAPATNVERFLWLFPVAVVLAIVGALLATR